MQQQVELKERRREKICYPRLSLAVYREIAAHLQQVEGIKTKLICQQSQQFDYYQSQVSSLWIEYPADLASSCQHRLEEILQYYTQLYGSMQRESID